MSTYVSRITLFTELIWFLAWISSQSLRFRKGPKSLGSRRLDRSRGEGLDFEVGV